MSYHFVTVFYHLPRQSFDALVQCAISALGLQERYSLVAASTFLVRSVHTRSVLSIHVLSTRIADSTYKRHAGERRLCRREATPARHTRTRYHARAARRLCGRSAKIGRPEPRRALFGSGRQDAS